MVRYEEFPNKYSTTINPQKDDPYEEILRKKERCKEILQKIEEKKRLINLTKAMSGAPASEGGMSREKANKTVQLLNKDISTLEKELRELEPEPKNLKINNNSESSLLKPIDDETKSLVFKRLEENRVSEGAIPPFHINNASEEINDTAINSPPKVEEKYKNEYVGTTFHDDSIMQDTPIKSLNWFAIIILLIIISSSLYFVIGNSNSQNTNHATPSDFSNNAEKVTNPIPTPKDSFDKINEYREQNKKYRILWSDDAYRLADFRASDMVKRNYFSHTTPDGKTVSDYIGKYNFYSSSAWGENLCKDCSDPVQTWIRSADHREILLGGWGKGAVACESDICVFIGVNE